MRAVPRGRGRRVIEDEAVDTESQELVLCAIQPTAGEACSLQAAHQIGYFGDFLSFNAIVATLNRQGHKFSFKQVPKEVFGGLFPGAKEIAEMLAYFEAHTYLGADLREAIALANKVAGQQPTKFAALLGEPRFRLSDQTPPPHLPKTQRKAMDPLSRERKPGLDFVYPIQTRVVPRCRFLLRVLHSLRR